MDKTTLKYEIDNHYNYQNGSFKRVLMFMDSEGRAYFPLCLVGEHQILIDVGGTDRQVPLASHLNDILDDSNF